MFLRPPSKVTNFNISPMPPPPYTGRLPGQPAMILKFTGRVGSRKSWQVPSLNHATNLSSLNHFLKSSYLYYCLHSPNESGISGYLMLCLLSAHIRKLFKLQDWILCYFRGRNRFGLCIPNDSSHRQGCPNPGGYILPNNLTVPPPPPQ